MGLLSYETRKRRTSSMPVEHDFEKYPELRNGDEMDTFYFQSPHKQILEDFRATVVKVHDADTITLRWKDRDFDFPLRFAVINAPELNEPGGKEARDWLEAKILNQEVDIKINQRNRVEKWGRLLGNVVFHGIDLGDEMMGNGMATPFARRNEFKLPDLNRELRLEQWF